MLRPFSLKLLYISLLGLAAYTFTAVTPTSSWADSRPLHGGRAAQLVTTAPATIILEAQSDEPIFLLEAPSAGEPPVSSGDPYDEYKDEFEGNVTGEIADPIEPWNRFWFRFNDIVWRQYVQPVYQTYELVTPTELRQGVNNFFNNLFFPVRFVNCLLQGKPMEAGVEFSRFIVNSTLGFGGLMQPAKKDKPLWCDEPDVTGFGQTLGRWGVGDGFYIVWPLIGPSTVRESFGLAADFALDPLTYLTFADVDSTDLALNTFRGVNAVGKRLGSYNELLKISVEPYSALRNAYVQGVRNNVAGKSKADDFN